jgi:hypothetical protein
MQYPKREPHLVSDVDRFFGRLMDMVMNLQVPLEVGKFFANGVTVSFKDYAS